MIKSPLLKMSQSLIFRLAMYNGYLKFSANHIPWVLPCVADPVPFSPDPIRKSGLENPDLYPVEKTVLCFYVPLVGLRLRLVLKEEIRFFYKPGGRELNYIT